VFVFVDGLEILFWRLFSAALSAAVSFPLLAARMLRSSLFTLASRASRLAVLCRSQLAVLDTLVNPRLLVSFTLPRSSGKRCSLSYRRRDQKKRG
jgi:hypothetical protein